MPRSKPNLNEDTVKVALIAENLKVLTTDLLHDFKYIYKERANSLKNSITESAYNKLLQKHNQIIKAKKYPLQYETRVYVISEIDRLMLLLLNMDLAVVDNLIDDFSFFYPREDDFEKYATYMFSHIFIFKGKRLVFHSLILPSEHAELMAVFSKENKVNFNGARYEYYTKPRLEARRNTDK